MSRRGGLRYSYLGESKSFQMKTRTTLKQGLYNTHWDELLRVIFQLTKVSTLRVVFGGRFRLKNTGCRAAYGGARLDFRNELHPVINQVHATDLQLLRCRRQ